jgi:hypothetical protein
LKIKNFRHAASLQPSPITPLHLRDLLLKELRETFTNFDQSQQAQSKKSLYNYLTGSKKPQSSSQPIGNIVKEVTEDEVVLQDWLTLEQCERVLVHLKESDRFKKLSIESVSTTNNANTQQVKEQV